MVIGNFSCIKKISKELLTLIADRFSNFFGISISLIQEKKVDIS